MKFKDWIHFNFHTDKFTCNIGDVYVKIFREKSYGTKDKILDVKMRVSDAEIIFGDYELFHFGKDEQNEYCTLAVFLCKSEVSSASEELPAPMIITQADEEGVEIIDQKKAILDYLNQAHSGASMMDDYEIMTRLSRAIVAFEYDNMDETRPLNWCDMMESYVMKGL